MQKQTLIDHLNEDLVAELSAIIQYTTYAAKGTGPYQGVVLQVSVGTRYLWEKGESEAYSAAIASNVRPSYSGNELPTSAREQYCSRVKRLE